MGTLTTNKQFYKPEVGGVADEGTWGIDFSGGTPETDPSPGYNGNWEKADAILNTQETELAALEASLAAISVDGLLYQVGDLYISASDTDPATTLGYGTWEAWGIGRALVGVGDNGEHNWTADEQRGSETHTLVEGELPSHVHEADPPATNTNNTGGHSHGYVKTTNSNAGTNDSGNSYGTSSVNLSSGPNHTHTINLPATVSSAFGGGGAHDNVQPSKAYYIWKRLT